MYNFFGNELCPTGSQIGYCDSMSRPLPWTTPGLYEDGPQPDYTLGLATHLLSAVDYVKHLFTIQTELSRQANQEDANMGRTSTRMKDKYGRSAPFAGFNLEDITNYIGARFLPFYADCGPTVFYAIMILVVWYVVWYIIEGLIAMGLAFKICGCSPTVLLGFCGRLAWLPLLPFAAAVRDRHIKDRLKQLLGTSDPPPPHYTTVNVRSPEAESKEWKWKPEAEKTPMEDNVLILGAPGVIGDPDQPPRVQVEAALDEALIAREEASISVSHTHWHQIMANRVMLQNILAHIGLDRQPQGPTMEDG